MVSEFDGVRANLYEKALVKYPHARKQDIEIMHKLLTPKLGDKILGLGEGNGFFCKEISCAIGECGEYVVTDPSKDQLINLMKRVSAANITIQQVRAQDINYEHRFDKVWSFGSFHHCKEQEKAMIKIYSALKKGGVLVLCDVFQGSSLAKHFDKVVSRYCVSGHDVSFLSVEFAKSLLNKLRFEDVRLLDLDIRWVFESEKAIGEFIHDLHAMTLIKRKPYETVLQGCKDILGVEKTSRGFELFWPMKALVARK